MSTPNQLNTVAVSLWLEDRQDEARELLDKALTETNESQEFVRLTINVALTEWGKNNFAECLRILTGAEGKVKDCDDFLAGKFNLNYAMACAEIGIREGVEALTDKAFIGYEVARHFYQSAGEHKRVGFVENNIAVLLIASGKVNESFEHIQRARELAPQFIPQIEDTEARAYLKLRQLQIAKQHSLTSCYLLRDQPLALKQSEKTLRRIFEELDREPEREAIRSALLQASGNTFEAAKLFPKKISRQGLEKKIKQHYPELKGYGK